MVEYRGTSGTTSAPCQRPTRVAVFAEAISRMDLVCPCTERHSWTAENKLSKKDRSAGCAYWAECV